MTHILIVIRKTGIHVRLKIQKPLRESVDKQSISSIIGLRRANGISQTVYRESLSANLRLDIGRGQYPTRTVLRSVRA